MRRLAIMLLSVSLAAPVLAQHAGHGTQVEAQPADPHAGEDHHGAEAHETHHPDPSHNETEAPGKTAPPPAAFSGPTHAADARFNPGEMAEAREQLRLEQGGAIHHLVLADQLEARFADGQKSYLWDVQGWYGGDINRLWFKSEGHFGNGPDGAELQALYSRAITPFFDIQAGVRQDFASEQDRTHLVLGLQGLMPYAFELDVEAFLSHEGEVTGRVEVEFDLQVSQRMLLQPRFEATLAAREMPELGIGSGLVSVETGMRLRYEVRREFAPYVGIGWQSKLGGTADLARAAGEDRSAWQLVAGVRSWF
jgi:copper resistance protein B